MALRIDSPLVVEFLNNCAGENSFAVVKTLEKGRTDEQIAKKTKQDINAVRAVLNKLHCLGIIIYSKEKAKKSNWYTYTWFLKKERIVELLQEKYKEELEELEKKLSFEQGYTFFKCENSCEKLPFELACEYDFKCPECGKPMDAVNNKQEILAIKEKINEIKRFID